MTATAIAVQYIDIKAEDDVETEITPAEPVTIQSLEYESVGNNIYKVKNKMSDGTIVDTGTLILAGQDRDPAETEDNNLLSGRTAEKGGSIAVAAIYPASEDNTNRVTTEAYYTIEGADSAYYVTAGLDGLLGTWDDIIKDSSDENRLGTYDIHANSTQEKLGWEFVSGDSVRNMLLTTEYVLDSVQFNDGTTGKTQGVYKDSTLMTKMQEIYNNTKGTKTAIQQNKTISMEDYTGVTTKIWTCTTENHTDANGFHIGTDGCKTAAGTTANVTSEIKNQAAISNVTFFALSIQEIAKAYNSTDDGESINYRKAQYAECGINNDKEEYDFEKVEDVYTATYWLRSPGYVSTSASNVIMNGWVDTNKRVAYSTAGARPACYATLA
jgi:hypothetical protein